MHLENLLNAANPKTVAGDEWLCLPPQYSAMLNLPSNDSFFTSPAALQLYQNHVSKVRCTMQRCYSAASHCCCVPRHAPAWCELVIPHVQTTLRLRATMRMTCKRACFKQPEKLHAGR